MLRMCTFFGGSGLSGDGPDTPEESLLGDRGIAVPAALLKGSSSPAVLPDLLAEVGSFRVLVSRTAVSAMVARLRVRPA